ncbi:MULTISPECIES: COX15/CtaA family protein [unclassified Arcicella]|uniref:COX15/CtaA family protein n=1 Tax=unclassified Arcicella TaxID=2644986 RepID=UPI002858890E|nr:MULTISPECIES: COX15/CtaA family protein [unclassified Arcicella]MDR6561227.1 cytochrome c oxidase assembly protein subunit 15 [Arcicella sp. BE51]MDR6811111.1 cytochrome c oxidase assembly protein subunit 15 [Arcicella sp. BE140]MDR6822461.1 cytochrome c oxidase assembly protein subunit 15 [Arcicella sp. BE139]
MLFRKLGILTIITIYLLVLAGGIVRSTGSGMGCPDWPKCFGMLVPPTDVSQLPPNYQEIYAEKLHGEVEFNATKTWIEYANRLVGAFTGLVVFATFLASIYYYFKKDRVIVYLSFLGVILIGANGALGKYVVDSFLKPGVVTLHMLLAVLVVFVLLYSIARAWSEVIKVEKIENKSTLNRLLILTLVVSTSQVLLGTQVREAIDKVIANPLFGYDRNTWIEQMGLPFMIHRSYSLLILALHVYLIVYLKKNINAEGLIYKFMITLLVIVVIEVLSGIIMAYFGVPAYIQPIHLTLAILSLGIQFIIYLLTNSERVFKARTELGVVKN